MKQIIIMSIFAGFLSCQIGNMITNLQASNNINQIERIANILEDWKEKDTVGKY